MSRSILKKILRKTNKSGTTNIYKKIYMILPCFHKKVHFIFQPYLFLIKLDLTFFIIFYSFMLFIREKNGFYFGGFEEFNDSSILSGFSILKSNKDPLNFALHTDDNESFVLSCREKFFKSLSINPKNLISLIQTHSSNIFIPSIKDRGKGSISLTDAPKADAILISIPDIPCMILTADCIPFFIRAKNSSIAGLVHSGWKGCKEKILLKFIKILIDKYKIPPKDILIGAGPYIKECCYEVSEEFTELFPKDFFKTRDNKIYFDLFKASIYDILELKIPEKNILNTNYCTCCNKEMFPSWRRDKTIQRMASFIMIKS